MRLITHNFLQSNVKGTTKGYPLKIVATKITIDDTPTNVELVMKMIPKLKYDALVAAVNEIRECYDKIGDGGDDGGNDDANNGNDDNGDDANDEQEQGDKKHQQIPTLPDQLPPSLLPSSSASDDRDEKKLPAAVNKEEGTTAESSSSDDQQQLLVLNDLYQVLFNVHVEEGYLVCPDTQRQFPISQGIPNMILHEDEI